jgi:RimJ/RimL family protein N-acetyltransferase
MLLIRPFRPEDHDVVHRWIGDPVAVGSFPPGVRPNDEEFVRAMVGGQTEPNIVRFAVEVDGRLVGEVQYRHGRPQLPAGVFEIGVGIWDPGDRGRGFGLEAQRQLVDRLFREEGARRVQAGTDPRNLAERRCLESLGFTQEGVLRGFLDAPDGGDIVMYAVLADEWRSNGRDTS